MAKYLLIHFGMNLLVLCTAQDVKLIVTAGDDVKLTCRSTTEYPQWFGPEIYENNTQLYNNQGQSSFPNPNVPEQKRLRLRWDIDKRSLIINDVILSDQGLYQCATSNAKINISVRVSPRSPVISNTETSENGTIIIRKSESQATSLVCISSGGYPQPVVQWYRVTTGTQPLTSSSSVVNETESFRVTQTYKFSPQRQDDGVQYICQSSFLTAPRHIATSSAKLLLNLKPNPPTVVQSSVVSAGNQAVVRCTTTGSRPAASITWSYKNTSPSGEQTSTLDSVTNTYTVVSTLKLPVTAEDNGRSIQCKVTHTLLVSPTQLTASINLNVQFSVLESSTRITGNRLTNATGSTSLTLNCTTGSSNPASNIKWYNGSSALTNTGRFTNWTGENNGQVWSQIFEFFPTRYMDGDVIRCSVSNILNSQSPVVDTTTLDLQYSPLVTIEGQNQYPWTEGDNNKALTCKVQSKPIATITWFHDKVQISQVTPASNQHSYNLSPINRTHYGDYRCKANNGIGTEDEKTVTIHVKFKPLSTTITGDTNIIANGRNAVQLTCTSDSSNPISDITWRNNSVITPSSSIPTDINGDYGGKKRSVTLKLTPTRDNDGDIISCEANNTIGTSGRSTKSLDLRYRPLINPMSSKPYVEGDNVPLPCTASSKPVSMFKWYRDGQNDPLKKGTGTLEHNGLTYTIYNVRRTDAATYRCNANNGIETPDDKNVLLTVHYPPDVQPMTTNTTVNASRIVITCNATGVPNTGYKYGRWVQRWPGYDFSVREYPNVNVIELQNLSYEHSGFYTCSASNGIKIYGTETEFIEGSVYLIVETFPVITNCCDKVSAKLKENVTVDVYYYSNVAGTNVKINKITNSSKEENIIYSVNQTNVQVALQVFNHTIKTTGTKARIIIQIKSQTELGFYDIVLSNKIGHVKRSLEIVPKGPPSVPSNLTVDNIQFNSVRVSWIAGYHGGAEQTFVIQISSDNVNWKNKSEVDGGLDESTDQVSGVISKLSASTTYYVRMFAYNKEGPSQFTDILNCTTSAEIDNGNGAGSMALIGGLCGGGTALILIIVVVLILFKRKGTFTKGKAKRYQENSDRKPVQEDEDDYGMQDNPMYVSAGPRGQAAGGSGGTGAVYSTVDKKKNVPDSNKNDVYAEVDKSKKTKESVPDNVYSMPIKPKGKKEKEKKEKIKRDNVKDKKGKKAAQEGDIYENATPANQSKNDEIIYENPEPSKAAAKKNVNKDGLIYADLTFNDQPKGQKKLVIHGLDDMTEYVQVDFTKKAEPLPDSDDENNTPK